MKKAGLLICALLSIHITNAQVGIGNPTPNVGSILDLTNASDKALLMPATTTSPGSITTFTSTGMLILHNDLIYSKTSYGINAITPWRFTGDTTAGIYVPSGLSVGVGLTPLALSPVRLHVAQGAAEITLSGTNGSIAIGDVAAQHILIDNNEIMSKSATSTAGILKLQEEAGTVEVRTGAAKTPSTVFTAKGSINANGQGRIRENGFDLLPVGSVIMWFGSVDAAGYPLVGGVRDSTWHICDGGTYTKMDGTGTVATPDLRERFVVGAGTDNTAVSGVTGYSVGAGGNANNFITLSTAQIPAHTHGASSDPAGSHSHGYIDDFRNTTSDGGGGGLACRAWCGGGGASKTTDPDGTHSHTINIANEGGGGSHENRPPYFALYFLMKL